MLQAASSQLPSAVNQSEVGIDGLFRVHQEWITSVLVAGVQTRMKEAVILINICGAHMDLTNPEVRICALLPNVGAIHQPLDAGVMASVKRLYKNPLISLVLRAYEEKLRREAAHPRRHVMRQLHEHPWRQQRLMRGHHQADHQRLAGQRSTRRLRSRPGYDRAPHVLGSAQAS